LIAVGPGLNRYYYKHHENKLEQRLIRKITETGAQVNV